MRTILKFRQLSQENVAAYVRLIDGESLISKCDFILYVCVDQVAVFDCIIDDFFKKKVVYH